MIGWSIISAIASAAIFLGLALWAFGVALLVRSALIKHKFGFLLWLSIVFWPLFRTFRVAVVYAIGVRR